MTMQARESVPPSIFGGAFHRLVPAIRRVLPRGIPLPEELWVSRHSALLTILWLHAAGLPLYALVQGYGVAHSLLEGSFVAAAALLAAQKQLSKTIRMAAVSAGLMTSSAVIVHLTGGLIEAHFHFFVMVAVVTLYQAWVPFLLAIGYVILHHGVMGALAPSDVYNHAAALARPWKWAAVHGLFISGASAAGLAAWRLNEDALMQVTRSFETQTQLEREQHRLREQARAQEATRQSEEKFRSLVQNSYDIVSVLDEDRRIDYISPSVASLLGHKPEEMLGALESDYTHEDDLAVAAENFARVMREPDGLSEFVLRARHADGSWRWLEVTLHNLLSDPAISGVVAHQRDITDRKLAEAASESLEEQLRQSQKLEAVGSLAAGIAHDFNNLLSVIRNFAQFVYEDLEDSDPRRDDVVEIIGAGERATNLVAQLLTFSRKDLVRPEVCDLNEIVDGMAKLLSRTIPENVELDLDLDDLPVFVNADPGQVEQVIINIAVNARDAMTAGGALRVATGRVDVSGRTNELHGLVDGTTYAHLTMADTGVGMDPATVSRVFEPFFTTKSRDCGTGLGLATVYGIVEQAGGRIFVRSAPGEGTILDLFLPLADSPARQHDGRSDGSSSRQGAGEIVLVAEDEPGVRAVVERVLRRRGYRVLSAANGAEALELAQTCDVKIDLLLTDLVMPQMSGVDLADQLPQLEVVFMSGYGGDVLSDHEVPLAQRYIEKPFSPEELLKKVREALDGRAEAPVPA